MVLMIICLTEALFGTLHAIFILIDILQAIRIIKERQ